MSCNLYFLRDLFNIYIWDRIHWDQIYLDRIYRSPNKTLATFSLKSSKLSNLSLASHALLFLFIYNPFSLSSCSRAWHRSSLFYAFFFKQIDKNPKLTEDININTSGLTRIWDRVVTTLGMAPFFKDFNFLFVPLRVCILCYSKTKTSWHLWGEA